MRVKVAETGLYTYPDVTIVCGEPVTLDGRGDVLLNPSAIVEVLSPSTERYDRGEKAEYYRSLGSLTDYIVVAQDRTWAEHYARQGNGSWIITETSLPDARIALGSIGCTLRLADLYDKVDIAVQ